MPQVKFVVTEAHIEAAHSHVYTQGQNRIIESNRCPVALALAEKLGIPCNVQKWGIDLNFGHVHAHTIEPTDEIHQFMDAFDADVDANRKGAEGTARPFEFTLNIPNEFLPGDK